MNAPRVRFLIADDHWFIRRVVVDALKKVKGAEFVEADNGEKALFELGVVLKEQFPDDGSLPAPGTYDLSRARLDCIITDFNMPHINGFNVLRMIRAGRTGVRRDIPIVMLTGFHDSPLLAAALKLDVNAFVTKPVSKTTLVDRIRKGFKTPWSLKTAEEYAAVETPRLDLEEQSETPSDDIAVAADDEDPAAGRQFLQDLQDGAVLAEDMVSRDGKLLLATGTVLSSQMISRLREVSEITGVLLVKVVDQDVTV